MKLLFFACLLIHLVPAAWGQDFERLRQEVQALGELAHPPKFYPADFIPDPPEGLQAITYEALPWKGQPTRVFAWLGIPSVPEGQRVPGIVLVHGGGGTAFHEWVQLWNEHGFAAISIAVEGQTDQPRPEGVRGNRWQQHNWPGPKRVGIYGDSHEPIPDQFMYRAVADTILARLLLSDLDAVDPKHIGVMGISWGGMITSTVIGIDNRFAFAIPTYGCGHMFSAENHWGAALKDNAIYRQVWDPILRMDQVRMPVLWLSWPNDNHVPLDCQAATYTAASGPRMVSLIPGMGHSHKAGWSPPDSYAFAKSVTQEGAPWCHLTSLEVDGDNVQVHFASRKPLDRARLIWTADTGFTGDREWIEEEVALHPIDGDWQVIARLPDTATAWFMNVSSGKLTVSSDYQERKSE